MTVPRPRKPCRKCGSTDRYASGSCKQCTIERVRKHRENGHTGEKNRTHYARHVIKPAENKAARQVFDPSIGAAFPAGLSRLMAGR